MGSSFSDLLANKELFSTLDFLLKRLVRDTKGDRLYRELYREFIDNRS